MAQAQVSTWCIETVVASVAPTVKVAEYSAELSLNMTVHSLQLFVVLMGTFHTHLIVCRYFIWIVEIFYHAINKSSAIIFHSLAFKNWVLTTTNTAVQCITTTLQIRLHVEISSIWFLQYNVLSFYFLAFLQVALMICFLTASLKCIHYVLCAFNHFKLKW